MRQIPPYKTRKGLQIGLVYTKPAHRVTREEVFWQGILLGVEPQFTRRKAFYWAVYFALLACVFVGCSFLKD